MPIAMVLPIVEGTKRLFCTDCCPICIEEYNSDSDDIVVCEQVMVSSIVPVGV